MANPSVPNGLVPVRHQSGAAYTGAFTLYSVAAGNSTAICIGDLVTQAGTSQVINDATYADVVVSATGDKFMGVCVGVLPITRDSTIYREASTQRLIMVADDPNLIFEVQESAAGTSFTANDIGLNANVVVAAGSTVTGLSGMTIDNSTEATTNTLDLKIVGLVNRPNNAVGESAKWLVRINRHVYANQVAGT